MTINIKNTTIALLILIVMVSIGIAYSYYHFRKMQRTYYAMRIACYSMTDFVVDHNRWPSNWDEYEKYAINERGYRKSSLTLVKTEVVVDFNINISELCNGSATEVTAIHPKNGHITRSHHQAIQRMVDEICNNNH